MFVGFGLLLVIVLFTALIGPYFVDWTRYKDDFEAQASRIIGQNVRVGGNAEVRLLPLPSLSFTDLSVGQNADGSAMLTVDRFSTNVELMPFLSGEVRIVDMTLQSPKFNFEIDENGQIAWTSRQQLLVDPGQVKLDKMTVVNGGFTISGLADGRVIEGEGISADISARSLFGPWRIDGSGLIDGSQSEFQISTGTYTGENPLRLKIAANRKDLPYQLVADGQVALRKDVLEWTGKFNIDPHKNAEADPLPVKTEGDFVITPADLEIPQYRSEIGASEDPFVLSGRAATPLRSGIDFRLEVDGRQIDVERIAKMQGGEEATASTLEARLSLMRDIVNRIPIPGFKGEIDLEIPAIIAGDTFIREVSASIRPFGESWEIVRLKTQLPGNTLVEANGRLGTKEDFGFHGHLLVASRQPSGFAAWAVGSVDPSIRQLNVAGFSADVTLTHNQTSFEQMELFLNQNRLKGSIKRIAPVDGDGAPAIIADLSGDRVSVDDLRAITSLVVGGNKSDVDSIAFSHDFDIALKADWFSGFDIEASGVDTQFQYKSGALSIARLQLDDFLGTKIVTNGRISDLLAAPEGNINLTLEAEDLSRLAGFLIERFETIPEMAMPALEAISEDPLLSTDTRLSFEIDSREMENTDDRQSRSRVIVNGEIAGTAVRVRSGLRGNLGRDGSLWIDLSGELSSADSHILGLQLGLGSFGLNDFHGGLPGGGTVSLESVGDRADGYSTIINAQLAGSVLSAKGIVSPATEGGGKTEFEFTIGSENASPVVASFGYLLPGMNYLLGDEVPLSLKGKITQQSTNGFDLTIEKSSLGGNEVAGKLNFNSESPDSETVNGELAFGTLNAGLLASGLMGFDPALVSLGGFADAGDTPFSGPAIAGLSGQIKLSSDVLDLGLPETASQASAVLSMRGGKAEITDIGFDWLGGKVSASAILGQVAGSATLSGQYQIDGISASSLLANAGFPEFLGAQSGLSGTIESSGKTPEAFFAALSGSGVLTYENAGISGVSSDGLAGILKVTDKEGFEISAATVAPLAEMAFLKDRLPLEGGSAPFTLRDGELRMRNISLRDASGLSAKPAIGDLVHDFVKDELTASISLSPDPGKQAVSGGTPEVTFTWSGTPGQLQLQTDTNGLEGYLSIRAFEAEQRRVELLQAALLEKQRFRRDLLNSGERGRWLQAKRIAELKRIEEERKAAEEAARLEAERLAKEEAERLEREAAEKLAREREAARIAEEKAAAEAAEKARIEAERKAAAEAAEKARLEKEREAEAARKAAEEAERARNQDASNGGAADGGAADTDPGKKGIEIKSLPAPADTSKPAQPKPTENDGVKAPRNLFENIEKLLFQ